LDSSRSIHAMRPIGPTLTVRSGSPLAEQQPTGGPSFETAVPFTRLLRRHEASTDGRGTSHGPTMSR
jgi:hypothetical protein